MHERLSASVETPVREGPKGPVAPAPKGHRQNGFDLLRLIAATMVIYGHSFPLSARASRGILSNSVQTIGVKIFFVISGFLIARSWLADPNICRYAQRRAVRIVPGLIMAVFFCGFVVGPIFTQISLAEYFTTRETWYFLRNIALYPVYALPGVFHKNVYPDAVNGSLWSLPVEVAMYMLCPIILGFRTDRNKLTLLLFALVLAIAGVYFVRVAPLPAPPVFYGTSLVSLLEVALYFQVGAIYAVFRLDRYTRAGASLFLLVATARIVHADVVGEMMLIVLLPFAVISIGTLHVPLLESVTRGTDISYGLYLYGFPVQQAVAALVGETLTPSLNFAIALPITITLAIGSWYGIERPGLLLRPRAIQLTRKETS